MNIEKQLYGVKRDRDQFESENEQIRAEFESMHQTLQIKSKELTELKQQYYDI